MPTVSPNINVKVTYLCPVSATVVRTMTTPATGIIPDTIPDPLDPSQNCDFVSFTPQGGGICFLATACTEYAGLPNDCEELQTMRRFRDEYVAKLPEGRTLIEHYYEIAPEIVNRIKADPQSELVFGYMLTRLRETVRLIQSGQHDEAHALYLREYAALQQRYPRRSKEEPARPETRS